MHVRLVRGSDLRCGMVLVDARPGGREAMSARIDVPTAASMSPVAPPAPSDARSTLTPILPPGPIVTPVCTNPCAHPFNWQALLACEHDPVTYRQRKCRECGQSTGPCRPVSVFIREATDG